MKARRSMTALTLIGVVACQAGSSEPAVDRRPGPRGSPCATGNDCKSGVCTNNICVGNGIGAPAGSACSGSDNCASGLCVNGKCAAGSNLPAGSSCASAGECANGPCSDGVCSDGALGQGGAAGQGAQDGATGGGESSSGAGGATVTTAGPRPGWLGAGADVHRLTPGCGPDSAATCSSDCQSSAADTTAEIVSPLVMRCFSSVNDLTPEDPAATIEQLGETLDGATYVHVRVTFDPALTDLSYGAGSCCGWQEADRVHKFEELRGSDHTELSFRNAAGDIVLTIRVDLISEDETFPCGFGTLGVTAEDGRVVLGDPAWVLASATSLSRNLNGCGYCTSDACAPSGDCTVDSPTTDESYTPNPSTPSWDYRHVYEVWIADAAFADDGLGEIEISYDQSSPSKAGVNTLRFESAPCPPEWTE